MKAKPGTPGRGGKKKHSGGWKGKVTLCFLSFLLAGANLSRAVQPSPPSSKVTPYKCKGIHGSFVSLTCLFLFTLCLCSRHFALRKRIRVCRNQKPIKICKGFGQRGPKKFNRPFIRLPGEERKTDFLIYSHISSRQRFL